MTPTLAGRWQIRIFLLPTVGLVISLIVSLIVKNTVPLFALLYVLLFGLVWDVIYQFITSFRWDRDWPTSFQVAAGVIEGALVWGLILTKKLPGIAVTPPFIVFLIQYGLIWLSIFVLVQGPLRIIWLQWRYQGGQWFVSQSTRAQMFRSAQHDNYRPAPQFVGGYSPQQAAPPQAVGGNYLQYPPAVQVVGGTTPQQAVPPLVVHATNPDPRQSPGDPADQQSAGTYTCECGFTSSRGKFCSRCGRPKVQQRVL